MKKFVKSAILAGAALLSLGALTACGGNNQEDEIIIGVAMSLYPVSRTLVAAFEEANDVISVEITAVSSGALQGQIEAGADIDVFFSAAMGQINALDSQGLLYGESQIVVRNSLALVVPIGSTLTINGFADLASDEVAQIGVGDEAMPAGNFAREVFEIQGVLDEANAKSVLGSNVAQILTWVELGEVDAGVIFMTDAATSDLVRVVEVADPVWHSPSVNPVAIVADSQNIEAAGAFVDFLFTPAARAIFEQYGFTMFN